MQGFSALILLLSLLLMMPDLGRAQSPDDYPGGYTLMPLSPQKIVLLSMTADVTFHDNGQETTAEVQLNYRLHNLDKGKKRTLRVAVPGYPAPKPPPTDVRLLLEGKEIKKEPGNQQWWIADITLKPDQRANLVMIYSAPLGGDSIVHFRYPLDLTAKMWPGRLESARFTIAFSEPPNPQSWISLTPENYQLTAESVTWSYDVEDPKEPIDFFFIRPSLWQQIQQARHEAAANNNADAYKTLGAIYAKLATASNTPQAFDRYYPLAVASYAMAQQLAPDDASAYLALAQLYQLRAEQEPGNATTYTGLAINEMVKALEQGVDDPAIQEKVAQGFGMLIASARLRGDFDAANTYLQRLETLVQQYPSLSNGLDIEAERQALAIDWARHVFDDQGSAPARAVLAQLFGEETVKPPGVEFAHLNSLYVAVRTDSHLRTIDINAATRNNDNEVITQLAQAFGGVNIAQVQLLETSPIVLHVEIPFDDASDLLNRQAALADVIPQRPEWALLQAILRPQRLVWISEKERWHTVETYQEQVSFVAVTADAGMQALMLERQAESLDANAPLNRLLADIWRQEANTWRGLAENSSVRYTLTLHPHPGAPLVQTWMAGAGDELIMSGSVVQYHLLSILLTALGFYVFFVLLTWLIFKLYHR